MRRPVCLAASGLALGLILGGAPPEARAQRPDSTLLRPTDIVLTVKNDPLLSGVFRSSGTSIKCGLAPYDMPHRVNSFHVSFPDDPVVTPLEVASVEFDADTLPSGGTSTSYLLNVHLDTPSVGRPPALVVRARLPQYREPGSATLRSGAGTDTLHLVGTATRGTKVALDMIIICHPRP